MDLKIAGSASSSLPKEIDFASLLTDVLRALRGAQSTRALSQTLGFTFDQVARWEKGRVRLKWSDFVDLCELKKIDLQNLFFHGFGFWSNEIDQPKEFVRQLIYYTAGPIPHREIARRMKLPKDLIERWLYGRAEITFTDVCRILFTFTQQSFLAWLDQVVGGVELPALSAYSFQAKSEQSLNVAIPYAGAIEGAIRMSPYVAAKRHSSEILAEITSLPLEWIERALPILAQAGRIKLIDGKYSVAPESLIINMQGLSPKEMTRVAKYWTDRALLRLQAPTGVAVNKRRNPNAVAFRVAPMSKQTVMAVTEALLKCHNEISALVDADEGPFDELRVLVSHHFSMDDVPD